MDAKKRCTVSQSHRLVILMSWQLVIYNVMAAARKSVHDDFSLAGISLK